MKLGLFWARSRRAVQNDMQSSFCSAVRRQGTNFVVTCLICKSSVRIFWHKLNAIFLCNLSESQTLVSVNDFSHTSQSPRCGRWTACLGGGRLQTIGINFWNGNTTHMSSIDLGRTLRKLLAAFCTFQHQFSPDGNRNRGTHTAALPPPSWDTAGKRSLKGFHRTNAGWYRLPVLHIHLHGVDTFPTMLPLPYVL